MEEIRNSINIIGLTSFDEIPNNVYNQIIQSSESETIFVPYDKSEVGIIFEIMIEIEILSNRIVETNVNKLVILDGIKKYKIIYSEGVSSKASILYLDIPYNTFIKIPKNENIDSINVLILDAYFSILSTRKIYSYLVLQLEVNYIEKYNKKIQEKNNRIIIPEKKYFIKDEEMSF